MKKAFVGILWTLMMALLLCACQKEVVLNIEETGKALAEEGVFDDDLTEVADEIFVMNYQAASSEDVVDSVLYMSSGATAEEIAVIECKDAAAAKNVKKVVEDRVEYLTESFRNYVPEELTKLENPVLMQ